MTLTLTRDHFLHMTRRRQDDAFDPASPWRTECSCGWRSAPQPHPGLLGWVCHVKAYYPPIQTPESIANAKAACYAERRRLEVQTGCRITDDGHVVWP